MLASYRGLTGGSSLAVPLSASGVVGRGPGPSAVIVPLRALNIEREPKLGFRDVLIRPKRSTLRSRKDVDLVRDFTFYHSKKTQAVVPVISANMDTTGTFAQAAVLAKFKCMTAIHKHYSLSEWRAFLDSTEGREATPYVMVSSGISNDDFSNLKAIMKEAPPALDWICIDVANGYTEMFSDFVKKVRDTFPRHKIVAGNVVTGDMTEQLILSGADVVKVGIGPGSVCTTRLKTGVGYPQLSAIMECADAAHGVGGHIIGDGGCTSAGDVAKAFAAGGDFVMLGGMLAAHDESGGELVIENGKKYKYFYGMSSAKAMETYHDGVAGYRAAEGKTVKLPSRGPLEATIRDILGGVRSTCTYVGARRLKELTKRTTFVVVREQENQVFGKESV